MAADLTDPKGAGAKQRQILVTEAIQRLNQSTTQESRRRILAALPRPVLTVVAVHFAGYGSAFPIGAEVVTLIERLVGKVQEERR